MIIPVRCVTCNKVICDKWRWFNEEMAAAGLGHDKDSFDPDSGTPKQTRELFDKAGLVRYCCRRHFMGQVDLIDKL